MSDTIDLTTTDDVLLATILAAIVDEPTKVPGSPTASDYAPEKGRVLEDTKTGDIYVGDGTAWVAAERLVTLLAGRSWRRLVPVTAATTLDQPGVILPVDTSGGTVTVTLATALAEAGVEVLVKDEAGNAGTNAITIDTEGGETIEDSASATISSNYGVLRLYSDGTNWYMR